MSFPMLVVLTTVIADAAANEIVATVAKTAALLMRLAGAERRGEEGLSHTSESVSSGWT